MKKTYIVNGLPRSGKDTFALFLEELCKVKKISVINPVTDMIRASGLNVSGKTDKDRILMNDLKEALDKWSHVTTKYAVEQHMEFLESGYEVLLIDIRNPKQIGEVCSLIEAETVLIRGGRVLGNPCADDSADTILNYKYCYMLDNRGTLGDFKTVVHNFYNTVVLS